MRRYHLAVLLALCSLLASPAAAAPPQAPPGYDAAYAGESVFLTLHRGDTGQFQVFFLNTGSVSWTRGAATEVALSVCVDTPLSQRFRCNVLSPYADWAVNWTSPRLYATTAQSVVTAGGTATFGFSVKVPADAALGEFYFRGELVERSTGTPIHPIGYYQLVTVVP